MGKGENNFSHVLRWPHLSLWLCSRRLERLWMGALRHTGGLIGVESDPLLSAPHTIRLSHFDSGGFLNCSLNLAATSSRLTYRSLESVLQVLCPANRLFCPPSFPHSLSTRSDRPVPRIALPSSLSLLPRPLMTIMTIPFSHYSQRRGYHISYFFL